MKKKLIGSCFLSESKRNVLKKMKLLIAFFFIGLITVTANTYSQQVKFNFSLSDVTVKEVFKQIEENSEFILFYNEDYVNVGRKVSLNAKESNIEAILDKVFEGTGNTYKIYNRQIVILPEGKKEIPSVIKSWQEQQEQQVSGKILNKDGVPLPGATIVIKGTTKGTTSDANGSFSLDVPDGNTVLVVRFIGYLQKEVKLKGQTKIDIVLQEDLADIGEVVVTALGIKKDAKSLAYSTTQLGGDEFTESREVNLGNALTGKVAGVNVTNAATGVAGSSRVIIRGNTSLTGENQPLYVVDGIPIDNSNLGAPRTTGGRDWGDGLSSINPDDIESLTVLKGSNAAALYGSRASNGVILITTKQGAEEKGLGIEFNSNIVFDQVQDYFDVQTEYGHGKKNLKPLTQAEALRGGVVNWGGRLDGTPVMQFDGVKRPYVYTGSKIDQFLQVGHTFSNSLAFSGGDAMKNFRISASDMENKATIPNSGMSRKTLAINANSKIGDKFSVSAKIQYSNEVVKNRPRVGSPVNNVNWTLGYMPVSINLEDLKGPTDKLGANADGTELKYSSNAYVQNPYWTAYQVETKDQRDRIIASGVLRYNLTNWLYMQGRIGTDWFASRRRDVTPYGGSADPLGFMSELEIRQRETNAEYIIGGDKTFGNFGINAIFGGNWMRKSFEVLGTRGENFIIPFFHSLNNLETQIPVFNQSEIGINSLFGSAGLSYKSILFLTFTGRNDWFSTLAKGNNSVFYPSVGLSAVLSDAFEMPEWLSFVKVRGSYAQVGGGANTPYGTSLTYSLVGDGHLGVGRGFIASRNNIPNPKLKPYLVTEYETGFDIRLFNNRFGIDFTYYNKKTTNDILDAMVSKATGFSTAKVNVGEMLNRGIEILITGTPITGDFRWDVSLNFANNTNKVLKLTEGIDVLTTARARSKRAWIENRIGQSFSSIAGYRQKVINGQKVYSDNGMPVRDNEIVLLGKGVAPISGGFNNNFRYKNFNLSFLLDFRAGGSIYSESNARLLTAGLHKKTIQQPREEGLTLHGVNEAGEAQTFTVAPEKLVDYYWRYSTFITENIIYNSDFIKLRELVFGYTLPKKFLQKTPFSSVNFSLVGRNLLLIYSDIENVDPESAINSSNDQGFEIAAVPPVRSLGFNLKVKF